MREIDWSVMGPALAGALFRIFLLSCAWTLLGTFVMKYFVRQVPLASHAIILFWATFRVLLVATVLTVAGIVFDISAGPLAGTLGFLGLCAVGFLITRHLARRYGTPTKFPAAGAKVMASMVVLTWILTAALYFFTLVAGAGAASS